MRSAGSQMAMDFDQLPAKVQAELRRVKDQETLPVDVDRWLMDHANPHLRSFWGKTKVATVDGKMFKPGTYFNRFFNEKRLSSQIYEVKDGNGVVHMIPTEVVLEALAQTRGSERKKAEEIDFRNGDVHHFLKHLAEGLARRYEEVL